MASGPILELTRLLIGKATGVVDQILLYVSWSKVPPEFDFHHLHEDLIRCGLGIPEHKINIMNTIG
jgi:hypothetical protein